jgi:hypothetical protein
VRLVDDGLLFTLQPIVDALDAGVVERPAAGDQVDRLARRGARPEQAEIVMLRVAVEIQVRQETGARRGND